LVELQKRTLGEVMGLSKDKAVEIMRQAGIAGAGDGDFPTYFKYRNLRPMLPVNATESEPGYWADKMVHREYLQVLLELYASRLLLGGDELVGGIAKESPVLLDGLSI
jgi:Na+-translocating ferredoxin:NAD+ oxidoreductase RnfC subunit